MPVLVVTSVIVLVSLVLNVPAATCAVNRTTLATCVETASISPDRADNTPTVAATLTPVIDTVKDVVGEPAVEVTETPDRETERCEVRAPIDVAPL